MKAPQPKSYFTEVQGGDAINIFQDKESRSSSLSMKQGSIKQNYFIKELEQLHRENQDLKASIQINKQLLNEILGKSEKKIRDLIEKNYWELEGQLLQAKEERDQARDECLIKDQIIEELKNQEAQTIESYEEQIQELKDNLERKEYGIQYKEQIWSTFERELKKAIKKDSVLYQKIQTTTQILVENLNETRISNVVKENIRLLSDQRKAVSKIDQLLKSVHKLGEEEVWFGEKHLNVNVCEEECTVSTDKLQNPHQIGDQELSEKVKKLIQFVETMRNKYEIMLDENLFLRDKYATVSKNNITLSKEVQELQEKLKLNLEVPNPIQLLQFKSHASTKISSNHSSNNNINSYGNSEEKMRNGLEDQTSELAPNNELRNSNENYKYQRFTLKLHPISPTKRMKSVDAENSNKNDRYGQQITEFEQDLNRFLAESPDVFKRRKIHRNNSEDADLSVINQNKHFLSPCSPIDFVDDEIRE